MFWMNREKCTDDARQKMSKFFLYYDIWLICGKFGTYEINTLTILETKYMVQNVICMEWKHKERKRIRMKSCIIENYVLVLIKQTENWESMKIQNLNVDWCVQ